MLVLKPGSSLFVCLSLSPLFPVRLFSLYLNFLFIYSLYYIPCDERSSLRVLNSARDCSLVRFITMGQELLSRKESRFTKYRTSQEETGVLYYRVKGTGYRGRSWTANRDAMATTTTAASFTLVFSFPMTVLTPRHVFPRCWLWAWFTEVCRLHEPNLASQFTAIASSRSIIWSTRLPCSLLCPRGLRPTSSACVC